MESSDIVVASQQSQTLFPLRTYVPTQPKATICTPTRERKQCHHAQFPLISDWREDSPHNLKQHSATINTSGMEA